jgi:DNA-binding NarL/FixJ family response regulator
MLPGSTAWEPARAVVVDDHPLYRAGIVRTLRDTGRFVVVGEAGDGETALALILEHRPELAVVDVRIPRLDGLSLLARLRKEHVRVPVLILSAFTDSSLVARALSLGAVAYVDKQAGRRELAEVAVALVGAQGPAPMRPRQRL